MPELNATTWLFLLLSYLLGSVPFGLVLSRVFGKTDIRQKGSGNIGATNVTRVLGKRLGLLTLLLDAGKGVVAVMLGQAFIGREAAVLCGLAAVVGHILPVFLKFRGGKGVATSMAVFLVLNFKMGLGVATVWLTTFAVTRISSFSAILAMIAAPSLAFLFADKTGYVLIYSTLLISILVIVRHRTNIKRLILGEEKGL